MTTEILLLTEHQIDRKPDAPVVRSSASPTRASAHRRPIAPLAAVGARQVLGEELFRGVLIRERKAADRSNESFGLLLVTLDRATHHDATLWDGAVEALASAKRDTDVLGWLEQKSALGVILSEPGIADASAIQGIETRVRRELGIRLSSRAAERFSIRLHVHPTAKETTPADTLAVDPLLNEIRSADRRAPVYDGIKRAFDATISLMLLAILSPLLLIMAALVKLTSPGPIFFRQVRVGEEGKPFTMLKFRSMRVNSDSAIHLQFVTDFIKAGQQKAQPTAAGDEVFKIVGDPRVTAIGRFIRKTSIDELPQLWNVVRGDMSLVGPRPPLAYEVDQYKPWHTRRVLEAKPGITGLWQVEGRSRTTFDEMVRLDLRYARTYSLWTDLKILLATPGAVISGKGAC